MLQNARKLGMRWDDERHMAIAADAYAEKLIDFLEVTCPLSASTLPDTIPLPKYAHSSENPLASAFGLNPKVMQKVKEYADLFDSPWVGEHLAILSKENCGALGYVINPIYNEDFVKIAKRNVNDLVEFYQRPIAIELGPQYHLFGDGRTEMEFISEVAVGTGCGIILDITHLLISNHNLNRPRDFGIMSIPSSQVIEIHVSGIRKTSNYWHDVHGILPDAETMAFVSEVSQNFQNLKAITLETDANDKNAVLAVLERLRGAM